MAKTERITQRGAVEDRRGSEAEGSRKIDVHAGLCTGVRRRRAVGAARSLLPCFFGAAFLVQRCWGQTTPPHIQGGWKVIYKVRS